MIILVALFNFDWVYQLFYLTWWGCHLATLSTALSIWASWRPTASAVALAAAISL